MRVIREYARKVAERFHPDKIILFGSYAYGRPRADSDVDLLVIMSARNQHDQAVKIRWEVPAPFAMDLIVRTPNNLLSWLNERESFHTEIVTKGKVLYEKGDSSLGSQSRRRLPARAIDRRGKEPFHDQLCFHSQQAAEKYLKAILDAQGHSIPKTHDLDRLLRLIAPPQPELSKLRRGLLILTDYAVDARYPGNVTTKRQAASALRWAGKVRKVCRSILGLRPL